MLSAPKNTEPLLKSIFDIIEEKNNLPLIFGWTTTHEYTELKPESFIFEGFLITFEGLPEKAKSRKYILTHNSLIRYKVFIIFF